MAVRWQKHVRGGTLGLSPAGAGAGQERSWSQQVRGSGPAQSSVSNLPREDGCAETCALLWDFNLSLQAPSASVFRKVLQEVCLMLTHSPFSRDPNVLINPTWAVFSSVSAAGGSDALCPAAPRAPHALADLQITKTSGRHTGLQDCPPGPRTCPRAPRAPRPGARVPRAGPVRPITGHLAWGQVPPGHLN